jgi:hypothetical protein
MYVRPEACPEVPKDIEARPEPVEGGRSKPTHSFLNEYN